MSGNKIIIDASAKRVINALSNIGYSLQSSICDIIDNSISHGKSENIFVCFEFIEKKNKFIFMIYDDGKSMSKDKLMDAMKLGSSDENYQSDDLGKFGMGLKTASLAHCNILSVIAKKENKNPYCVILDKNMMIEKDEWIYSILSSDELKNEFIEEKRILTSCFNNKKFFSGDRSYTFLVWRDLFILKSKADEAYSDSIRNRQIQKEQKKIEAHIRLVFHRFLNGENGAKKIKIFYNGVKLKGWDPCLPKLQDTYLFKSKEQGNKEYISFKFKEKESEVKVKRYILPKKDQIANYKDKESLIITEKSHTDKDMKIDKWQGLYFYRNNRLIDYGGWYDGTGTEPHITYARCSVDLNSEHDKYFTLNINKSKISIQHEFKIWLKEIMPKFRAKAKELYGGKKKREVNNSVRRNPSRLKEIIKTEGAKNDVQIIGPNTKGIGNTKEYVEVINTLGRYLDREKKFLNQDKELLKNKIISEELSDPELLWQVIPDPRNFMLVKINTLNELYKLYYEEESNKYDKITAVIDSIIIALAFTEVNYKTESTKQLFDDINRTIGSLINKLIENKVIK